jgi:hypothetical protein
VVKKLCVKIICNRVVEYLPQEKVVIQASVLLSYSDMTLIIKPFVRHDENAEKYVNIFSQIIRSTGNQFASKLRQNIVQYGELEATELQLTKLVQIADVRLTQYARLEVAEVPANLRASLMLYEGVEVNQVAQNTTFSMRDNINVLSQELKKMLCFLWRHDGHGTNIIAKTRKDISDLWELHDSSPQIIQCALIGKLLVDVMLENPASTSQYPFGCVYAAARCFFISKDQLVLRSADASASQVATIMHLFRLAYCSVVRPMSHPLGYIEGAKVLVKTVMERPMMNTLGPMIRHLREIQMQKPKVVDRHFSRNGEIVVQGLVFKPEIWKTLIPRVVSAARLVLSQIFDGKEWEVFLTTTLPLLNVRISGGTDDDVHFQVQQASGDISSDSLKLSPQLNEMDQDHLSSIVEFCLHGLGLGSMRYSETLGLQDFQVLWGNGALYFYAKSSKKWKAQSKLSTELTQHKLPKSISRIVLLFRLVISLQGGDLSSFVPVRNDRKYCMKDFVQSQFCLPRAPHDLQVRHFFASLTNYLFPVQDDGKAITSDMVAMQSHHAPSTHASTYFTHRKTLRAGRSQRSRG